MMIKILGGIDVIAALILFFGIGTDLSTKILLIFAVLLISKSFLGFLKDFASWIDFLSGILFFSLIFISLPSWISIILGLLLLQKGFFSLL